MEISTKAIIFSAFVFPGLGLWILGKRGRAAIFAVPATIALIYIMVGAWKIARKIAEKLSQEILATGQISLDMGGILTQVHAAIAQAPELLDAQWIFIISWVLGIFSTYAAGKTQEQSLASPHTQQSSNDQSSKE